MSAQPPDLPTAAEIARAMAGLGSIEELDAYGEEAVRRGLAPGESAAIAARRFDLLADLKTRGRRG